jgi:hypothetical protein
VRAYTALVPTLPDLAWGEYASERHGNALDSNAWTALGAYQVVYLGYSF